MVITLFLIAGFGILGHEYLKEGYFFNWGDIFTLEFTHEKTLLVVVAIAALFLFRQRAHEKLSR